MLFRVAKTEDGLAAAPTVEADGPAVAAAEYVSSNGLAAGTYWVQELPEPQEVDVTIEVEVIAKLRHQGGPPASVELTASPAPEPSTAAAVANTSVEGATVTPAEVTRVATQGQKKGKE